MKEHNEISPSSGASNSSRYAHSLHLACRECQRKKIKCDRIYPCGQCSRGGITCVPSTRKPRAKTGIKAADAELRQRIAKLEKLVENFQGEDGHESLSSSDIAIAAGGNDSPLVKPPSDLIGNRGSGSPSCASPPDGALAAKANKYVASSFWSSLQTEVKAIAEALDDDGASDDDTTSPETTPSAQYALDPSRGATNAFELIFCPPGAIYVMPGALQEPDPAVAKCLLDSYILHVEPLCKLFHVPTLKAFMEDGQPYLKRPADAPCNKALRAAIWYSGINAFTEEECQALWGRSLDGLVQEYQHLVDIALYQADPLNTTELATLQALTVYVSAVRVLNPSRRAWSLVGLVARIARAMSVHKELPGESPFLAELRRRLWHGIVFLDCYASTDRGSEPAIHPDTYNRSMCSNINDEDFHEDSAFIQDRENEVTDMSLTLMVHDGSALLLRMALLEDAGSSFPWQQRLEIAYEYERTLQEKYLRHGDPNEKGTDMLIGVAKATCQSLMLRAVRPLQYHASPPPVDSPWVMQLAINLLRHSNEIWDLFGRGRRMPWVPWHAMAVALAGLCSNRDTDQANEAWELVEKAMSRYGDQVADSERGMLWKPLERLYRKAAAFRIAQGRSPTTTMLPAVSADAAPSATWNGPLPQQQNSHGFNNNNNNNNNNNRNPVPDPMTDALGTPLPENTFEFNPDMQAALSKDPSWLDWEVMMKDLDGLKTDQMQWT